MTMTQANPLDDLLDDLVADQAVIPAPIAAQARELHDLRKAIKSLKKRENDLRTAVQDHLLSVGADSLSDGTVSIARATHERENIDRKRFVAKYPKVFADVTNTIEVSQIRVEVK